MIDKEDYERTIVIQIGNTDDKLKQSEWAYFNKLLREIVFENSNTVHFVGFSPNSDPYQNAAYIANCDIFQIEVIKNKLIHLRKLFNQDSIAIQVGQTIFI